MMMRRRMTAYHMTAVLAVCILCSRSAAAAKVPKSAAGRSADLCEGYEFYYDHGTEMCERCSEICQNAQLQGTEVQCQTNCPEYRQAMQCKQTEGWYYDDVYKNCESCCELCNKLPPFNTRCQQNCLDFLALHGADPAKQTRAFLHKPNEAGASQATTMLLPCDLLRGPGNAASFVDYDWPLWICLILVVLVILCIGVGLVVYIVIWRKRPMTYTAVVQPGPEPDDRGGQRTDCGEARPIKETEGQRITIVTIDGRTELTLPPKTAFADLSYGHVASNCI